MAVPEPPDPRHRANGLASSVPGGRTRAIMRRLMPRSVPEEAEAHQTQEQVGGGTHRRADLIVRVGSRPVWRSGEPARVGIDVTRLMLFAPDGSRIDPPHR